jgi:hypothetical protein
VQRSKLALILITTLFGLCLSLHGSPTARAEQLQIAVTGSLQAAVDAARPGDTLVLAAKTYSEKISIEVSGEAQAPITIKGAGMGASVISGSVTVVGSNIVLEDLAVDVGGADDDGVDVKAPAKHVTLRRVHLQNGTGYGVRVGNDVDGVLIEGCTINNFDAGSQDAHGVGIMTASNVTITGCEIFGNSGDGIQVNTPDYAGYNRVARNIRIEGNRIHDNRENALDIKSTDGLVFHNNQAWGYHTVDSSTGMAVQVQYGARNIVLTGNQIWDSVQGIEVTRGVKNGAAYPIAPSNVLIAGNLIRAIVDDGGGDSGNGSGIIVRISSNVRIYNNTVINVAGAAIYVGFSESGQAAGLDVRNNVLGGVVNDLRISLEDASGVVVDYNHYVNGKVNEESLSDWTATGLERHATSGDPKLDASWRPAVGSPLIDSGIHVELSFLGGAPDRGWGELATAPVPVQRDYQYQAYLPMLRR